MGEESIILEKSGSQMESQMEVDDNKEVSELTDEQKAILAEKTKEEGNAAYKDKQYEVALDCYSKAINLCPNCAAYYGNRAAVLMMLNKYSDALKDARQSTQIDPKFFKGFVRTAKCLLSLGEPKAAINQLELAAQINTKNDQLRSDFEVAKKLTAYLDAAEKAYNDNDFRKVLYCMDRCIEISPACIKFVTNKAESLALLKRYDEAQSIAFDLLRKDNLNADALYVRGLCLYYEDNVDKAFNHFQRVLQLAPDHVKAKTIYKKAKNLIGKKEEGNTAFKNQEYEKAYEMYTAALNIDPLNVFTNSKLYCNRATVCSKLKRNKDAVEDCSCAIKLDENYIKAYLRRAKCYMDEEMYEEAVVDYEKVCQMQKTRENNQLLQEAKLELKKSKRKDYYKILGITKTASDDEIRKAYRKRALRHHPDRHSSADEETKKEEEKKFKEIGEAYAILSDPKKRDRYDTGQDLEEGGFAEFDPNTIFQAFFGGGGPRNGGFPFGSGGFPGETNFSFSFG